MPSPTPPPTLVLASPTGTSDRSPSPAPPAPGLLRRARRLAGSGRRALLRLRDGALHPWRRRRARARLRALPRPGHVLFLCLGNVCRSPYAEHRFRALVRASGVEDVTVTSAGFIGPGRPAAELALAQALERGVDTSSHRSQVVDRALLDAADLLVLVDAGHAGRLRRTLGRHEVPIVVLGDLDPEPVDRRTIRDPWGQDPVVYQRVFDRLDRCLAELALLTLGSRP